MRGKLALLLAAAACGMLSFGAAPALGATLEVDDDGQECPDADFSSIQAAVDAADAADTVAVCAGTYAEQVLITGADKDGLILRSKQQFGATISYPGEPQSPEVLVTVDDAYDVTIRGFELSGPYPAADCAGEHIGVHIINSQSARVALNRISELQAEDASLLDCEDGFGVIVERASTAAVALNDIRDYQKGGVVVDGEGSVAAVLGNRVAADEDVQPFLPPNGVQVSDLAAAAVARNLVIANQYTSPSNPDELTGSGILAFDPRESGLVVRENVVVENDDNLPLIDTDGARIDRNRLRDARVGDGIFVSGAGVVGESAGNLIRNNRLSANAEHDCHDDSAGSGSGGTANTWSGNQAGSANRPGICPGAAIDPPTPTKMTEAASPPKVAPAKR